MPSRSDEVTGKPKVQGALRSDHLTLPAEITVALEDVSAIDVGYPERDD